MSLQTEFGSILTSNEPIGPLTALKVGGPAAWVARPTSVEQLAALLVRCRTDHLPHRLLGGATNILAPDEGIKDLVIVLSAPAFCAIQVDGTKVHAGAGASLADLISATCRASLTGLEPLVGIPGSVGGAVRLNAGARTGDIGQFVQAVEALNEQGQSAKRTKPDLRFGYRTSNLDDAVILSATLALTSDAQADIDRRIRRQWIIRKNNQPFGFEPAAYVFRNSRGLQAGELIERAGLRGARVGGAQLCDRDLRFIVANPGATAKDVRRLIETVQAKVAERLNVAIELQIDVW